MKQLLITLTFAICCIILHEAVAFQFTDCGSKLGKFTKVEISDCDTTKNECLLKRNTSATLTLSFTLAEDVKSVKTVVHGKVLGIDMPFHLQNPDGCVDSGLHCPLPKDHTYEYNATLPILKSYPKVSVLVKWELQNENNEDIICMEVPARIH